MLNLDPGFAGGGASTSWLAGALGAELIDAYGQHDWTYACVEVITKAVANIPIAAVSGDKKKPTLVGGPWQKWLDRPCPGLDRADFWRATLAYLYCYGGAGWVLLGKLGPRKKGEVPVEAWPFPAKYATALGLDGVPIRSLSDPVGKWRIVADGKYRELEPWQICVTKFFNPANPLVGFSPLWPSRTSANFGYAAQQWAAAFFLNGCDPGGWLTVPKGEGVTEAQRNQILGAWEERHKGPNKRGRTGLLVNGALYQPNTVQQRDMQFIGGQQLARESVLATLGVMKAMLGLTDDLNYATFMGMRQIFYETTVLPIAGKLVDVITHGVMAQDDETILRAELLTEDVAALQADYAYKVETAAKLVGMGHGVDAASMRMKLGMPPTTANLEGAGDLASLDPTEVQTMLAIIVASSGGEIPPASAKKLAQLSFPALSTEDVAAMIDPTSEMVATKKSEPVTEGVPTTAELAASMSADGPFGKKSRIDMAAVYTARRFLRVAEERLALVQYRLETFILPFERRLDEKTRAYLKSLQAETRRLFEEWVRKNDLKPGDVAALTPADLNAILFDRATWDKAIKAMARGPMMGAAQAGLQSTAKESESVAVKVSDPRVIELMGSSLGTLVVSNTTVRGIIRAQTQVAIAAGETIAELQKRLVDNAAFTPEFALRIARTETGFAASGARFIQYGQDGVEDLEWLNAKDGEVRESHQINGETRKRGERFSCGLLHPHEVGGDPGEVINCRCDLLKAAEY